MYIRKSRGVEPIRRKKNKWRERKMELEMMLLIFASVVVSYVVLGILRRFNKWYYVSRLGDKKTLLPPGDLGWPLVGNTLSLFKALRSNDPDSTLTNMYRRYGEKGIYMTHLFWKPSIIFCTPETCRRLLTDNEKFGPGYPPTIAKLFGEKGFNNVSQAEHKRLRRLTTPPMSSYEALSLYIAHTEDHVIGTLKEWAHSMDQKPMEFVTEMNKLFFRIISQFFLGSSSNSVRGTLELEKLYKDILCGIYSLPIDIPGSAFHKAIKARKQWVEMLQAIMEERRKIDSIKNRRECMMDLMMEMKDEEGSELDDENIIDLLLTFLVAGHDSSTVIGTWATINLHQHPQALEKAKKEQEEIIGRRSSTQKGLSLKEIREMEYLRKAIDETLRVIYPPLIMFREAKVDVNINGYLIPKGWRVIASTRAVHTDPKIYPNPKEFDPSRWDHQKPRPGEFIPFGGGTSICPGADLAKFLISIFLHYFLLGFKLEQLNPNCKCNYFPLTVPADNCLAKIKKIK